MASGLLNGGRGDFGSRRFWAAPSDNQHLPSIYVRWCACTKSTMTRSDKLILGWGYRGSIDSSVRPAARARRRRLRRARRAADVPAIGAFSPGS